MEGGRVERDQLDAAAVAALPVQPHSDNCLRMGAAAQAAAADLTSLLLLGDVRRHCDAIHGLVSRRLHAVPPLTTSFATRTPRIAESNEVLRHM